MNNKKIILFISILLFAFNFSFAQKKLSKKNKKLVDDWQNDIKKFEQESGKKDDIAVTYQFIAGAYKKDNMISESLKYINISIESTNNPGILQVNNSFIAEIYLESEKYNNAQTYNLKALDNAKKTGSDKMIYKVQIQVAKTYMIINEYTNAIKYYEAALKNAQNRESSTDVRKTLKALSPAYSKGNEHSKSIIVKKLLTQETITSEELADIFKPEVDEDTIKNPTKYEEVIKEMFNSKEFKDSIYLLFSEKQKKTLDSIRGIDSIMNEKLELKEIELANKQNAVTKLAETVKLQKNGLIIFSSLLLIIIILSIIIFIDLKNKRKQNKILAKQKEEIQMQAVDLDEKNQELQTILEDLQSTQNQLIQSEKMASLGKLVASIAHELNTPLGAINSSISTLDASSETLFELLPKYIKNASPQEYKLFKQMLAISIKNNEYISSREIRKIKRILKKELESFGIEDSAYIAGILAEIGVHDNVERFVPLFKKNVEPTMETIYNLSINNKIRQNIKTAIEKASKVIYALKNYSRTSNTENKIKGDVRKSLDSVLTIYQNQLKQGVVVTKKYSEIPEIMCFPDDLGQVWTNIIHNAIHAMSGKGELGIEVEKLEDNIKVSFSDSGIGIPDSIKDKVFMPFFTTKPEGEGTGLGLDIVKQIIDKHSGQITFETEIGKGTTFIVLLPIQ